MSGKEGPGFMKRVVYKSLGRRNRRLVVGPGRGLDNGVISLGGRRVMVVTSDPISVVPSLGMEWSAWLSVHVIASDYTTSGLRPEFALFDFNFPPSLSERDREAYVREVGRECRTLGVSIAGGHTGSYPGAGFTVAGAGTMLGFGVAGGFLTPAMSRRGDAIVATKGAAIESTAYLANSFPEFTRESVGRSAAARAQALLGSCSTVKDAEIASTFGLGKGGITSMHDATEGGVYGALEEMADASGNSFVVEEDRIPIADEVRAVCTAFGLDPYSALSEGTLLLTCSPGIADALTAALARDRIGSAVVGEVGKGGGLRVRRGGGRSARMKPLPDGYWGAYSRASESGLK